MRRTSQARIAQIKHLVLEYFAMEYGQRIDQHLELIPIFDVSRKDTHPHAGLCVYISRRGIKHFVEERKREMKNRPDKEILKHLLFAIEHVEDAVTHFDEYVAQLPRHLYLKEYSRQGMPILRVVLERAVDHLEICSIHFKTLRKKK